MESIGSCLTDFESQVLSAVDTVVAAAAPRHVTVAAGAYGDEDATDLYRRGVRCFRYGTDSALLLNSYRPACASCGTCLPNGNDSRCVSWARRQQEERAD